MEQEQLTLGIGTRLQHTHFLFYARKYYIIFNGCQFNVRLIETGQNRVTRVGFGTFGDVHPKEKEQIG